MHGPLLASGPTALTRTQARPIVGRYAYRQARNARVIAIRANAGIMCAWLLENVEGMLSGLPKACLPAGGPACRACQRS